MKLQGVKGTEEELAGEMFHLDFYISSEVSEFSSIYEKEPRFWSEPFSGSLFYEIQLQG